ncbi:MAG: phosphatidate phosphatase App1 family protein [Thermoguttaceae bacterium]
MAESASPWRLYEPLRDFCRQEGFPDGTFHMKHFRLTDSSVWQMLASQEEFKTGAIQEILARLPGRRFALVGDSDQQEPEVYGQIVRARREQVAAIFIRNGTGQAAQGGRFQKALAGIPPDRWRLFDQPAELEPLVGPLREPP